MRHFTIFVLEGNAGSAQTVAERLSQAFPGSSVFSVSRAALPAQLAYARQQGQMWDLVVDLGVLGDDYRDDACRAVREQMPDAAVVHVCASQGRDHRSAARHLCTWHQGPQTLPAIVVAHCDDGWEREMVRKAKIALTVRAARKRLSRLMPDPPS